MICFRGTTGHLRMLHPKELFPLDPSLLLSHHPYFHLNTRITALLYKFPPLPGLLPRLPSICLAAYETRPASAVCAAGFAITCWSMPGRYGCAYPIRRPASCGDML